MNLLKVTLLGLVLTVSAWADIAPSPKSTPVRITVGSGTISCPSGQSPQKMVKCNKSACVPTGALVDCPTGYDVDCAKLPKFSCVDVGGCTPPKVAYKIAACGKYTCVGQGANLGCPTGKVPDCGKLPIFKCVIPVMQKGGANAQ